MAAIVEDMAESTSVVASAELRRNVVFVALNVHSWAGQYQIDDAVVSVGDEQIDQTAATKSRWKLLPEAWAKKFTRVENKLRGLVDRVSLKFPIRGVTVVPRAGVKALFDALQRVEQDEFLPLVDSFCVAWPDIVAEHRVKLTAKQFQQAGRFLPATAEVLRNRFRVDRQIIPMAAGGPAEESFEGDAAGDYAREIERKAQEFIVSSAQSIRDALHEELDAAVANLASRLDDQGLVRGGTLDQVSRAFAKMEAFSFAASPDVLERMRAARVRLRGLEAGDVNEDNRKGDRTVSTALLTALRSLQEQSAAEASRSGRFGRRARSMDL